MQSTGLLNRVLIQPVRSEIEFRNRPSVGLMTRVDSVGAGIYQLSANENGEMGTGCALAQRQVRTLFSQGSGRPQLFLILSLVVGLYWGVVEQPEKCRQSPPHLLLPDAFGFLLLLEPIAGNMP